MSNISRKYNINRFYLHIYLFLCTYPEYVEIVYQSSFALSSVDYDSDAENEDLWRICKRLGMFRLEMDF